MLESITFTNYRGFRRQKLPLRPETVVVGRNNAGKSTVIEGFRLIALVAERYPHLNYRAVPDWLEISLTQKGVGPDIRGLGMRWENLFYQYSEPPASVTARFSKGEAITVHLGAAGAVHAVLQDAAKQVVRTKAQASGLNLPFVGVLPQVAPVSIEETVLGSDYVLNNLSSYLAPLHFRNQLNVLFADYFLPFKTLVESSWPGVQVLELVGQGALPGTPLELLVRDGDFAAEVAWMGHGLQMWLQTMWFVARTAGYGTIVLDEPDVYMHPDLQRRLIRFLRGRYQQVIVATHSTEILAETHPENVLIVERLRTEARFATDLPAVQRVVQEIGSAQNLQITRLWTAGKLLLVEGDDLALLKRFQDVVSPDASEPLDAIPNMPIGGWSGWPYAVGSAMVLQNAVDAAITTYCILDSDYYAAEEIAERLLEASQKNVRLHIWRRKEIENYVLVPSAIARLIGHRTRGRPAPTEGQVAIRIDAFAEELKTETTDVLSQYAYNRNKAAGVPAANRVAREALDRAWQNRAGRWGIVSGKGLLSRLSAWAQAEFGASFGAHAIVESMSRDDVPTEIVAILGAIEAATEFPRR